MSLLVFVGLLWVWVALGVGLFCALFEVPAWRPALFGALALWSAIGFLYFVLGGGVFA